MKLLLILLIILPAILLLGLLLRIVYASHHQKKLTNTKMQTPVGLIGIAETELNLEGLVLINNEIWRASATSTIAAGKPVRVIAAQGVYLLVEPSEAIDNKIYTLV
ncbi:MAG: NfeD family protein [Acidobacteriota bacterium]